jgi:4-hydroxy-tetrahydrodipicolinate reductase
MSLRIAIAGASGRMGRMLVETVTEAQGVVLAGAFDRPGVPAIGRDAGEFLGRRTGVTVTDDVRAALSGADVLVDFTRPEGALVHLAHCAEMGVRAVVGTTGFDEAGRAAIAAAARRVAVVFAPNMSVGVNVTLKLLEVAAGLLSEGFDIEITEAHHRHKVDAPSGTAIRMGEVIAGALGRDLDEVATWARHGVTGERPRSAIGFSVVRGGDIVGDHTVLFAGTGERIEITHRSSSRATYAEGSLRACRFLAGHTVGLFDMQDVLGLRTPRGA